MTEESIEGEVGAGVGGEELEEAEFEAGEAHWVAAGYTYSPAFGVDQEVPDHQRLQLIGATGTAQQGADAG